MTHAGFAGMNQGPHATKQHQANRKNMVCKFQIMCGEITMSAQQDRVFSIQDLRSTVPKKACQFPASTNTMTIATQMSSTGNYRSRSPKLWN